MIEERKLRQLGDAYFDQLQREEKKKRENLTDKINSEINCRWQAMESNNTEIENIKVGISRYKDFFTNAVSLTSDFENSTKGIQFFFKHAHVILAFEVCIQYTL